MHLSLKLGRIFTSEAALPANAERQLTDPFADDNSVRNRIIAILILVGVVALLWLTGLLNSVLPDSVKRIGAVSVGGVTVEAPEGKNGFTGYPLTAEGNGKRQMKTRAKFFDDARGSATECAACLDSLVAKRACTEERIEHGKSLLVRPR